MYTLICLLVCTSSSLTIKMFNCNILLSFTYSFRCGNVFISDEIKIWSVINLWRGRSVMDLAVGTVLVACIGMPARYFLPRKLLAPPLSTSLGATHRTVVLVVSRL